jgi:hypothetical protein
VSKRSQAIIYRTRPWAIIAKPHAVTTLNSYLALYYAGVWDDEALDHALIKEVQRGTMLTSWESVPVELTGKQSGRCIEFTMPKHGDAGDVWWCEESDIIECPE